MLCFTAVESVTFVNEVAGELGYGVNKFELLQQKQGQGQGLGQNIVWIIRKQLIVQSQSGFSKGQR